MSIQGDFALSTDRSRACDISPLLSSERSREILSTLGALYADCFSGPPWHEAWTAESGRTRCEEYLAASADVLVARIDGRIAGFTIGIEISRCDEPELFVPHARTEKAWYLAELAVDAAYRRTGIGSELLRAAHDRVRAAGFLEVVTCTRDDNAGALRTFERAGYLPCAIHPSNDSRGPRYAILRWAPSESREAS